MTKNYFSFASICTLSFAFFLPFVLFAQESKPVKTYQDEVVQKANQLRKEKKFSNVDFFSISKTLNQRSFNTMPQYAGRAGQDCDQGDNSNNFQNAINITAGIQYEQADDFVVSTGNTLQIKSIELNVFAPKKLSKISFKFYKDSAGKPGELAKTIDNLIPYAQPIIGSVGGNNVYAVFVDTDLSFPEGTYWIEPLAQIDGEGFAFWEISTIGTLGNVLQTRDSGGPWTAEPSGGQAVFKLHCEHVQPPASQCLFKVLEDVEPISNVIFAGINNASNPTLNASPGLEDFTSISGNVSLGQTYTIKVEGNTSGDFADFFSVFIDWNQNGILNDPGEVYEIGSLQNSNGADGKQVIGNINVPATAAVGTTKMRIIKNWEESPLDPCGSYWYGQAEDYTLNVGQLGVNDVSEKGFSYAPNPVKDYLSIHSKKKIVTVSVSALTGQKILANQKLMHDKLNLSGLSTGVYMVQISFEDGSNQQFRIIKK